MENIQDEQPFDMSFEQWVEKFGKSYDSEEEKQRRKNIWEQNLEVIHNQEHRDGENSYKIQLTQCSDQTLEELSWMSCLVPPLPAGVCLSPSPDPPAYNLVRNPNSVDWRERGCVTRVLNQWKIPACWIFSAVYAVESHNALKNKKVINLSVQQLVDCMKKGNQKGFISEAFQYIKEHGSICEDVYPPSSPFRRGICHSAGKQVAVRLDCWKKVTIRNLRNPEQDLETAVAHIGPVAAVLLFSSRDRLNEFHSGFDGIFYDPGPHLLNQVEAHAVLIVGYGSERNKNGKMENYWIVKNSWGFTSTYTGYHKIAKDRNNNCFIASYAEYPVVQQQQ